MLVCVQHQHQTLHHLPTCVTHILDTSVHQQTELSAVRSPWYPSVAELDAFAQKTADSPLSIRIFPNNIRVPQHKQINRTVNGLDTSGQRFSPFSAGHEGLLAIVKTQPAVKGLLKSSEGRRCKLSPIQMAVAPYMPPSNRHRQKSCDVGPDVPERPLHSIIHHMSRPSNCSPAFLAATAASCSDSDFTVAGSAWAVLPTQSADVASGNVDGLDFWQHGAQHHFTQVYGGVVGRSPDVCVPVTSTRPPCRPHDLIAGALEKLRSSPLNRTATDFSVPPCNGVLSTSDSESYNQPPHLRPHTRGRPRPYPSGKSWCQASLLSNSLKSLECLISDIHPPCIKEQMLGRRFHHQDTHLHLPVFR